MSASSTKCVHEPRGEAGRGPLSVPEGYLLVRSPSLSSSHIPAPREGSPVHGDSKKEEKDEKKALSAAVVPLRRSIAMRNLRVAKPQKTSKSLPPVLDLTPNVSHVYRFQVASSGSYTITGAGIAGALGVMAYGIASVGTWASSFKIRKVTVWPSPSSSAVSGATLAWAAGTISQEKDVLVDRTLPSGVSVTDSVSFAPPASTLAGMWLSLLAFSSDIFVIDVESGSIIDLAVSYTLSNSFSTDGIVVASAVVGQPYYLALDGPASNKIVPVGLPTTH